MERMKLRQVNIKATGERIQQLRKYKGITAGQITDALGISRSAYYRWVWGDSLPTVDNLVMLSDIFEVMIDDIIVAE